MILQHLETFLAFAVIMLGVSLLVTILNQMAAALLGLRGTNLLWGLKTLLGNVDEGIRLHAESIARQVLTHPLISDSAFSRFSGRLTRRWRLASAIRLEELLRALRLVAPRLDPGAAEAVEKLLRGVDEAVPAKIRTLAGEINALGAEDFEEARRKVLQIAGAADRSMGNLEAWFNTAMDRVSQRFALQMRVWTVVFSVLVAFAAHLDAFHLLSRLSSDAELRASLSAGAEVMAQRADEVFSSTRAAVPADYAAALEQLGRQYPEAAASLAQPPAFQDPEDAAAWVRTQLGAGDRAERIAGRYQDLVQSVALRNRLDALSAQAGEIRNQLGRSGLQLVPEPYPGWPRFPGWPRNRHFWGILVAAALLSLGAPFWFNALKSLSNLRPALAGKVGDGQQKKSPA